MRGGIGGWGGWLGGWVEITYIREGHGGGFSELLLIPDHVVLVVGDFRRGQGRRLHEVQVVVAVWGGGWVGG